MIYEETHTIKEGKDTFINNLETKKITKNDEIITQYCILAIGDGKATIQQGNTIKTIIIKDNPHQEILELFQNPPKEEKKQPQKKTPKKSQKGEKQ